MRWLQIVAAVGPRSDGWTHIAAMAGHHPFTQHYDTNNARGRRLGLSATRSVGGGGCWTQKMPRTPVMSAPLPFPQDQSVRQTPVLGAG